jgi:hypothetical protein
MDLQTRDSARLSILALLRLRRSGGDELVAAGTACPYRKPNAM